MDGASRPQNPVLLGIVKLAGSSLRHCRDHRLNVIRLRLPTQAERGGDFSQTRDQNGNLLTSLYDSSTGAPFPNLKIPAQRLYAPSLAVLNRYPLPTLTQQPGTNYNYEAQAGSYNQLTRR